MKLFTMQRTEVSMQDFIVFVQVDISDSIRDNKTLDPADVSLLNITEHTVFSRVQLRRYVGKYFPERIKWTGIDPVHNDTRERDTHRYYWSAKMAKDFIILTGKKEFTFQEVEGYFRDRVFLNYLNEMIREAIDIFEDLLIRKGNIKVAFFDEHVPYWARQIPFLKKAKR